MTTATPVSAPCSRSSSIRASGSIIGCGRPSGVPPRPGRSTGAIRPVRRPHAGLIGVLDRTSPIVRPRRTRFVAEGAAREQPSDQGTARRHPTARLFNGGTHCQCRVRGCHSENAASPSPASRVSASTTSVGAANSGSSPSKRADQRVSPSSRQHLSRYVWRRWLGDQQDDIGLSVLSQVQRSRPSPSVRRPRWTGRALRRR